MPRCNICREGFKADDPDEVIIRVRPYLLETSAKSGRKRFVEQDFRIKVNELDGCDYLVWHLRCLVDELQDPSIVGWTY